MSFNYIDDLTVNWVCRFSNFLEKKFSITAENLLTLFKYIAWGAVLHMTWFLGRFIFVVESENLASLFALLVAGIFYNWYRSLSRLSIRQKNWKAGLKLPSETEEIADVQRMANFHFSLLIGLIYLYIQFAMPEAAEFFLSSFIACFALWVCEALLSSKKE